MCNTLDVVDQLYLEDFASTSSYCQNIEPKHNLQTLRLSISFEDSKNNEEFYTQSLKQLRQLAPNLQRLSFSGGYIYNPDEEVSLFY